MNLENTSLALNKHPCCIKINFGDDIAVYPEVSVILNIVKDPALGLCKRLCEMFHFVQHDTNCVLDNIYIIALF